MTLSVGIVSVDHSRQNGLLFFHILGIKHIIQLRHNWVEESPENKAILVLILDPEASQAHKQPVNLSFDVEGSV